MDELSLNIKRARRAKNTLEHYKEDELCEGGPISTGDAMDLIVDLLHFVEEQGGCPATLLADAAENFYEESHPLSVSE